VTDDELKSSATHDGEKDLGDYTIPSLGPGRGTCMSAPRGADHAVDEHEAIMQFETGTSYRRRNRKEAAIVPYNWWKGQRSNYFRPEV
jgi:hypothetical protein